MLKALLLAVCLSGGLVSQVFADTAEQAARYYEDALSRYERRDDAGAVIQLKNALKQDRRMLPALVLLGQVYLRQSQPAAAENVLADAERLGAARAQIAVLQAQAYYGQGKFRALIDKFSANNLPPAQQVDMLLLRARAYFDLTQFDASTAAAQQAARLPGGEARGLGGIFFDYVREDPERTFAFVRSIGDAFLEAYVPIVERRRDEPWGERERRWQLLRRGRYVEFNLVYDRGTLFGLETEGRIESILVSMPPLVAWAYAHAPEEGSPEAELVGVLRHPRAWIP